MVSVRLIVASVVAAIGFSSGWVARGVVADRDVAAVQAEAAKRAAAFEQERAEIARAHAAALNAAQEAAQKWRRHAASLERELAQKKAEIVKVTTDLREEINNARDRLGVSCRLHADWVRLYDAVLQAGNSSQDDSSRSSAGGASGAAKASSAATEWDVMAVHSENSARWAECRAQLLALQDWARSVTEGKE